MGIREDIEELKKRKAKALEMGGADKTDLVHARGSYTARERIAKLLDVDTFTEVGLLAHSDLAGMEKKTAADGKICGFGEIDGRTVAVCANDVSVLAGSGGRIGHKKSDYLSRMAVKNGYPIVNLGEAGGARIPDIQGSDGMSSMTITTKTSMRRRQVPLVATIMGECFLGTRPGWRRPPISWFRSKGRAWPYPARAYWPSPPTKKSPTRSWVAGSFTPPKPARLTGPSKAKKRVFRSCANFCPICLQTPTNCHWRHGTGRL